MNLPTPVFPYCLGVALMSLISGADGLHIRDDDDPAVGQYRRVWQPNAEAAMNPGFTPEAALFSAIGWPGHPTEWYRQYGLISPVHFVGAAHYLPDLGWKVRFLGQDGNLHDYPIKSLEVVKNADGDATDLFLGTLKEPWT